MSNSGILNHNVKKNSGKHSHLFCWGGNNNEIL